MEQVEVWVGRQGDPVPLFGPLPGVRLDDTLAYEFELPARFVPWPGRTLLERVFVLRSYLLVRCEAGARSAAICYAARAGSVTSDLCRPEIGDMGGR